MIQNRNNNNNNRTTSLNSNSGLISEALPTLSPLGQRRTCHTTATLHTAKRKALPNASGHSMMSIVTVILLACVVTSLPVTHAQFVSTPAPEGCDLRCWLQNLTIIIPDQSIVKDGFNLSMSDLKCKGIDFGGINSSFIPPTSLTVLPYGLGTTCHAQWVFRQVSWPHVSDSGSVDVAVNHSSLNFGMVLTRDSDGLANSSKTIECSTKLVVTDITFHGGITGEILNLFRSFIASQVSSGIDQVACQQLRQLVDTNLTQVLVEANAKIRPYLVPQPPTPAPEVRGAVNLLNNSVVRVVGYVVHNLFGADGALSVNKFVNQFTNNTGSIVLSKSDLEHLATFSFPFTTVGGNITVGLLALNVSGINTWGDIDLFAVSNYSLGFHSDLELLDINATFFVNVSGNPQILDGGYLYEEGLLVAQLDTNNMNTTMQVAIKEMVLKRLELTQLAYKGCALSALEDANLTQLYFNMNVDFLNVVALAGDLETDLDALINNVLALFTNSFGDAIPAFFNSYVASAVQQQANNFFGTLLTMNETCPAAPATEATFNKEGTTYAFSGAGGIFVLIGIVLIIAQKRRSQPERAPLLATTAHETFSTPCLALHPRIPILVRYVIPLLLLLNIAIFISSNASVGASVVLILTAGEAQVRSPPLFTFSLTNTVHDMWKAGVYPLSLLIACFSGAWPYLKLLIMLGCWVTPPSHLKTKKRESLLMALDMLGKWSLIDAFVLICMMVAFQFHISSPPLPDSNPPEYGIVDVFVEPDWAFYSFLLATMMSLVLTHVVLAYHHKSLSHDSHEDDSTSIALCSEVFKFRKTRFTCTWFGKLFVVLLLLASAGLIIYGIIIDTFAFEFQGATGYLLELLGDPAKKSYSAISLGEILPKSSTDPNGFGVRWIQATYFAFTITIPLLHLLSLLVLWMVPLRPKLQGRLFVVTEILNAWSAMEVFIISIIAAVLEIEQFAQFIVGDRCDQINVYLKKYFSEQLHGNYHCFDVKATLEKGCWVLFAACLIYICVATLVMKASHSAIAQRNKRFNGINDRKQQFKIRKSSCCDCWIVLASSLGLVRPQEDFVH